MSTRLLRRLTAILLVTAFFGASMLQSAPAGTAVGNMAMAGQDQSGKAMPCKDMTPTCMIDLGCIFLLSLPASEALTVTAITWSPVAYWPSSRLTYGRMVAPDLQPPIPLA